MLKADKIKELCTGLYAVPGFIDARMHLKSAMLSPEALRA